MAPAAKKLTAHRFYLHESGPRKPPFSHKYDSVNLFSAVRPCVWLAQSASAGRLRGLCRVRVLLLDSVAFCRLSVISVCVGGCGFYFSKISCARNMSESDGEGVQFFEGVEKLLEIWFVRSENDGKQSGDLRKIPRYVIFHNCFPIHFTIPIHFIIVVDCSNGILALLFYQLFFLSMRFKTTKFSTTDLTK